MALPSFFMASFRIQAVGLLTSSALVSSRCRICKNSWAPTSGTNAWILLNLIVSQSTSLRFRSFTCRFAITSGGSSATFSVPASSLASTAPFSPSCASGSASSSAPSSPSAWAACSAASLCSVATWRARLQTNALGSSTLSLDSSRLSRTSSAACSSSLESDSATTLSRSSPLSSPDVLNKLILSATDFRMVTFFAEPVAVFFAATCAGAVSAVFAPCFPSAGIGLPGWPPSFEVRLRQHP
mmetsp:Transcript_67310/g.186509  ORF Transcript_67310/g.186509 Transcript_67310/m.186509 type:complete len:241 (+) Transcript_67310:785-1507(+)